MNLGKLHGACTILRITIASIAAGLLIRPSLVSAQVSTAGTPQGTRRALSAGQNKLPLREGWTLQTSLKVKANGKAISTAKFVPNGWHHATVPTTVVAALVKDKTLPDPFFSMNLRQFPGVTYPIGGNFSNIPMTPDSPYAASWWYRKAFLVPAAYKGKTVWLNFKGINYRANIWLNGKPIASSDDVAGAWRTYEFNVTDAVKMGAGNVLAVQAFAPTENDLAITFVDWNPAPPDKNMGLWGEVYLTTSGPVALRYATVVSKLDLPATDQAHLTVTAQLKNATGQTVKGTIKGKIEDVRFEREVELSPNQSQDVTFTPDQFQQLNFSNPRIWWPAQMTCTRSRWNLKSTAWLATALPASLEFGR